MLVGPACLSKLFLKFQWNDQKCRQIFFNQLLGFFLNFLSLFRYIPQIYLIMKRKNTKGISILSLQLSLVNFSRNFAIILSDLYDYEEFFDFLLNYLICLFIVFYHTHINNNYTLFDRIHWYLTISLSILFIFSILTHTLPINFISYNLWYIFPQILSPIPQALLIIFHCSTESFSSLPYLYRTIYSANNAYNAYYYTKNFTDFVYSITNMITNSIVLFLSIITPRNEPKCCIISNSPILWNSETEIDLNNESNNSLLLNNDKTTTNFSCLKKFFPNLYKCFKRFKKRRKYKKLL